MILNLNQDLTNGIATECRTANLVILASDFEPGDFLDGPEGSVDRSITCCNFAVCSFMVFSRSLSTKRQLVCFVPVDADSVLGSYL